MAPWGLRSVVASVTAALWLAAPAGLAPSGQIAQAFASERAPRISDREIVDRLARLETRLDDGLARLGGEVQQLRHDMDSRLSQIDGRFQQVDGRFQQVDGRFEQIEGRFQQIDGRFAQVDTRFQQMDDRFAHLETRMDAQFDRLYNLLLGLLAAFTAMTVSTIGFALWDRRSMLRPLEATVAEVRDAVKGDRQRINALVEAMQAIGRLDARFAEILRRLRLL